jgi:hypothetical protein
MKIVTIDEVNSLGCCPCTLPTCDSPREGFESRSASYTITCAFDGGVIGSAPLVPCNVLNGKFRTYTEESTYSFTRHIDDSGGNSRDFAFESHITTTVTYTLADVEGERVCSSREVWNYTLNNTTTYSYSSPVSTDILTDVYISSGAYDSDAPPAVCTTTRTVTYSGLPPVVTTNAVCQTVPSTAVGGVLAGTAVTYTDTFGDANSGVTTITTIKTVSDRWTEAQMVSELDLLLAAEALVAGGAFVAKLDVTYASCPVDPEADPVVYEPALDCPLSCSAIEGRYRYGVPYGYERTTWEMQWDEGFFPQAWLDWDSGGRIGSEPTRPTRLTARSWIYGGTDEWSDWFDLPAPDEAGEIRRVNVMIKCWKSTRHGVKPTAFGPVFVFDS